MAVRTIRIPVADIIEGGTRQEFYRDLRSSLDLARRAGNQALAACFAADTELMRGGKCPKLYTYPLVSSLFPGVAIAASAICRRSERMYKQKRIAIARGFASVPNLREVPWPLLATTLNIKDCGEYMSARFKLIEGKWWTVRLKSGSNYRTQIAGLRSMMHTIGDSTVAIDRGGSAVLRICVDREPLKNRKLSGVLRVASHREHLIVAAKERDSVPFVINAPEVKEWERTKSVAYQRFRQDRKHGDKKRANSDLIATANRYNRRTMTHVKRTAAAIVKYAIRRGVARLTLDLTVKSYLHKYPWHMLSTHIAYRCEDAGIEFANATQQVVEPSIDNPHIYFRYSPLAEKVKIGKTINGKSRAKSAATDSPDDELTILAVDNQSVSKLTQREKYWHAYFAAHRLHGEWFDAVPVITWLREAGWLGNAGNRSQIAQVLDLNDDVSSVAIAGPTVTRSNRTHEPGPLAECGIKVEDIATYSAALEVGDS